MITQELKQLVVDEALKLRKYATKKEKQKLDFKTVKCDIAHCIYGQMTGSCYTKRALSLKEKCAKPYSTTCYDYYKVNSESINNGFSPIEFYINQPGAKIEDLVNLIKS